MWRFFNFFLNLLAPLACLECGKAGTMLCASCAQTLEFQPTWQDFTGFKVWTAFVYREPSLAAKIVKQWKYQRDQELIKKCLREDFVFPVLAVDFIIPVPLHKRRELERGFNQAQILAQIFAEHYQKPINTGLKRLRYTPQQAKLSKAERIKNVKGAFKYRGEDLIGKTVLLVDDVVTTGSTLNECRQALLQAGAQEVMGGCLFRAQI